MERAISEIAPPGSESVACFEGKLSERGRSLLFSMKRVSPDKPKQQGRREGGKEVGEAIIPSKRVMTVEGRASGRTILGGDTSHGKQSQLTDGNKPKESNKTYRYRVPPDRQSWKPNRMKATGTVYTYKYRWILRGVLSSAECVSCARSVGTGVWPGDRPFYPTISNRHIISTPWAFLYLESLIFLNSLFRLTTNSPYMNPPSWQEDKSVQTKKEKVHAYIRPVYGLFLSWP